MESRAKALGHPIHQMRGRRGPQAGRLAPRVGLLAAVAVAGVVAGAVLTKLLLRARADRRWDQQVERLRAQGAL